MNTRSWEKRASRWLEEEDSSSALHSIQVAIRRRKASHQQGISHLELAKKFLENPANATFPFNTYKTRQTKALRELAQKRKSLIRGFDHDLKRLNRAKTHLTAEPSSLP
ncbi:MAG: hypothetical protein GY930_06320 [bacterium]|nr:hypothetical protein [bacterium]